MADQEITDPAEILSAGQHFYEELYSEKQRNANSDLISEKTKSFTSDSQLPELNEKQKSDCEGLTTESESLKSLKSLKNGKSPGTDGLTAEFYKKNLV